MVAYHSKSISHIAFEERGIYLITVGGNEKMSIAIWENKGSDWVTKERKRLVFKRSCAYMWAYSW